MFSNTPNATATNPLRWELYIFIPCLSWGRYHGVWESGMSPKKFLLSEILTLKKCKSYMVQLLANSSKDLSSELITFCRKLGCWILGTKNRCKTYINFSLRFQAISIFLVSSFSFGPAILGLFHCTWMFMKIRFDHWSRSWSTRVMGSFATRCLSLFVVYQSPAHVR